MSVSVNQGGDDVEVDHMHVIDDDTAPLVMPDGAVDHTRSTLDADSRYLMTTCSSFALRSGFCLAVACVYISTSLLVAFFPRAAMSRGLSQIDIGIVFAILPAMWLLTAPIWANYASRIGPRFLIIGGVGVISLCMFSISILEPMKTRGPFLAACLCIRAIQGAASAATMTGNYVLVASVYPNALGEVIGVMEIFVGVGYAVGPPIGGVVYESSGFRYVFITFGAIIALSTFILFALFPSAYFPRKAAEGHARNTWQLLGDFRILIDLLVGIVAQAALTMLEPSAQIHITNFYPEITPSKMGLLFMTAILFYAISAPLAGCISDSRVGRHPVIIIGLFLIAFGLYMFGPIGWPFTISLPVLISGLAVVGLGMGTTTVPLVPDIIEAAGHGNEETAAGVAGMFTIGDIIGPALGSILIEKFEFNTSAATFGIAALTLAIALVILRVFGVISTKPASRNLHVH